MNTKLSSRNHPLRSLLASRLPDYASIFERYNFFDVFSLDGGGYHVFLGRTGTIDDVQIADRVLAGEVLSSWGTLGNLDYEKLSDWENVEQAMWLQRLYILPSLARAAWLTGRRDYRDAAMTHLRDWAAAHPLPEDLAGYLDREKIKFNGQGRCGTHFQRSWFDFQPAARTLWLCWTLYLLIDDLEDSDIAFVVQTLRDHARALMTQIENWPDKKGNHAIFWRVALYYLGCVLQEEPEAEQWRSVAGSSLGAIAAEEINQDGLPRQASPSYMLLVLMQFREVWALSQRNNFPNPIGSEQLCQMLQSLEYLAFPDGTLVPVNDGYRATLRPTLEIAQHLFPDYKKQHTGESVQAGPVRCEAKALVGTGILTGLVSTEGGPAYVMLDATRPRSAGKATHAHVGRLGLNYFTHGRYWVGDSGTGPYNEPMFGQWYRRAQAHSTILVDGKEDADYISEWEWDTLPTCTRLMAQVTKMGAYLTAESDGYRRLDDPVSVKRELLLANNGSLLVCDTLFGAAAHTAEWRFRMAEQGTFALESTAARFKSKKTPKDLSFQILLDDGDRYESRIDQDRFYQISDYDITPSLVLSRPFEGQLVAMFVLEVAIESFGSTFGRHADDWRACIERAREECAWRQ